jgi:predicted secreted Zn-dependent protease
LLSWGRIKNDHILSHEQGHFDIAEIYARKLNKALSAYVFNRNTVSRDVNAIYDDVIKLHHKAQEQYDDETDYSRNFKEQEEWKNRIAAELKILESFAKYRR